MNRPPPAPPRPFPVVGENMTNLRHIKAAGNRFNGSITDQFNQLAKSQSRQIVSSLDLSSNWFSGTFVG